MKKIAKLHQSEWDEVVTISQKIPDLTRSFSRQMAYTWGVRRRPSLASLSGLDQQSWSAHRHVGAYSFPTVERYRSPLPHNAHENGWLLLRHPKS